MSELSFKRQTVSSYKGQNAKPGFRFLVVSRITPSGEYSNVGEFPFKDLTPEIKEELYKKLFAALQKKYPDMELTTAQLKEKASRQGRTCIIKLTPDNPDKQADIQTGGVSNIEILDMLHTISSGFAKAVIADYVEITGDNEIDPAKMEDYMKFLRNAKL